MKLSSTILIISLLIAFGLQADEKIEKKLTEAGLKKETAAAIAGFLSQGYSQTYDYLKKEGIKGDAPNLVPVWKWIVARRLSDNSSESAFWFAYEKYDKNEWLRLLGHPHTRIALFAISQVEKNNDVDAVPTLIGLLSRKGPLSRSAARVLFMLTHNLIHLPDRADEKDMQAVRKAWVQWYAQDAAKSQAEWRKTGDARILTLLESDNVEDAYRGFKTAKQLGIKNDKKYAALLNKFCGKLEASLTKKPKGGYEFKITNTGKDAIVGFKHNTYMMAAKAGGMRGASCSPYLANWEYAMILKKGQSWVLKGLPGDKEIRWCKVTERLRESDYKATSEK